MTSRGFKMATQAPSLAILAPSGSPRSSKPTLELEVSRIRLCFRSHFGSIVYHFPAVFLELPATGFARWRLCARSDQVRRARPIGLRLAYRVLYPNQSKPFPLTKKYKNPKGLLLTGGSAHPPPGTSSFLGGDSKTHLSSC